MTANAAVQPQYIDSYVQVRSDGVQVLVELTGQTANNRLGVLAMQPAPVQATWIGYPNSTGLQSVHYRFTGSTHIHTLLPCPNTPCMTSVCSAVHGKFVSSDSCLSLCSSKGVTCSDLSG